MFESPRVFCSFLFEDELKQSKDCFLRSLFENYEKRSKARESSFILVRNLRARRIPRMFVRTFPPKKFEYKEKTFEIQWKTVDLKTVYYDFDLSSGQKVRVHFGDAPPPRQPAMLLRDRILVFHVERSHPSVALLWFCCKAHEHWHKPLNSKVFFEPQSSENPI